jgi:mannosyltransferase OCH1-like enzyme
MGPTLRRTENFEEMTEIIPKIIHQTAPTDESKWKPIWKQCQDSWKNLHPDFEYRFWSDEDMDTFMKENYPEFYENVFVKYDVHIKRVDALRYFILKHFGGIYADMDYMCQKRFFEELQGNNVYIAESPWTKGHHQNALMISPKGHIFWDSVIDELQKRKDVTGTLEATGPYALEECISKYKEKDLITLNKEEFSPILPNQDIKDFPDAKALHLGTCSWC